MLSLPCSAICNYVSVRSKFLNIDIWINLYMEKVYELWFIIAGISSSANPKAYALSLQTWVDAQIHTFVCFWIVVTVLNAAWLLVYTTPEKKNDS